ncbi:interleukin-1 receptor type 1-like [Sphaerodactylus townsendi]|uniref:interleukin-1 receptor type 1-like n=1 Tax=Sphaerodactylus townsendi TaxID=933632 RepID=UPI002025C412|nr:interleukin-1 receptor type 1-like [Sphaerodactylus townsendi]XP_048348320.1 interleukin-1 receptor type 1-like [Sphaerodactylus townsendi]XP_048348321.1 interleukin-1 receptor type 1-like [Sphaerodactylus townsendi]
MKVTTLFSCSLTTMFLSSIKADHCNVYNWSSKLEHFVLEGQPVTINCLSGKMLNLELKEDSLTWYRAGSHAPVLEDPALRIQQRASSIWFLPAILEDSGFYECTIRNSTHCSKMYFKLTVFQNSRDSCFNGKFALTQYVFTTLNGKIVCPDLNYFREENPILTVLWYKDCKLIEDRRFEPLDNYLMIANITMEDQGNYTCRMPYYYMGKQYNVSRDITLNVTESLPKKPPEIFFPRNHSIEVDLVSDGKTYDAFVLYTVGNTVACMDSLDNFVLKLLPEVLEQQCGYKLFIVGRDDLPGQATVSVTEDTIKQSRRLMIILEPELSSCSRLEETSEQQIAVYNALIHCGIKVILIEMEKIRDYTNMPESIQYIKQKHGAVRWKKDFAEKSQLANTQFWKNVRYQMPPRRTVSLSETHLLPQFHSNSVMTITR